MYETQLARSWTGTASQKSLKSRSANIAATKLRRLFCTDRFRSARSYFKTRRAFGVSEGPQVNDFQGPQGKKPIIIRQKCGEETIMLQHSSTTKIALLASIVAAVQPLPAQSASESDRLEKLERAVEQLQKRNAELEAEVRSLKSKQTSNPADAKFKTKVIQDGKTYVEKAVVEEKLPIYVQQRGPELKLVLGGFIQVNAEGGDAFAFNGNFGQTAINDRFRLRRARINLTGDYAEQFDFKMEGDFATGDGLSSNRLGFEATDIWINWHQFAAAQIKAGQYKAPFGLEQLTPDTALYTIERSLPTNAITPERQIGVELWGKQIGRASC